MNPRIFLGLVAFLAVSILSPAVATTFADSPAASISDTQFSFALVPDAHDATITGKGYFIYKLGAAQKAAGATLIKNPGTEAKSVQLAVVEATTAQTGGSAFSTTFGAARPSSPANWVHLDRSQVSLQPDGATQVAFTVDVPANTKPGQYLTGIAAYIPNVQTQAANHLTQTQAGANINVQVRYIIPVQVEVPGAWSQSVRITSAAFVSRPSGAYLDVHMVNDGSSFVQGSGKVEVTDSAGQRVIATPLKLGPFITSTQLDYPLALSAMPSPGSYNVSITLGYGQNRTATFKQQVEIAAPSKEAPSDGKVQVQQSSGSAAAPTNDKANSPRPQPQAPAPDNAEVLLTWLLYAVIALALASGTATLVLVWQHKKQQSA